MIKKLLMMAGVICMSTTMPAIAEVGFALPGIYPWMGPDAVEKQLHNLQLPAQFDYDRINTYMLDTKTSKEVKIVFYFKEEQNTYKLSGVEFEAVKYSGVNWSKESADQAYQWHERITSIFGESPEGWITNTNTKQQERVRRYCYDRDKEILLFARKLVYIARTTECKTLLSGANFNGLLYEAPLNTTLKLSAPCDACDPVSSGLPRWKIIGNYMYFNPKGRRDDFIKVKVTNLTRSELDGLGTRLYEISWIDGNGNTGTNNILRFYSESGRNAKIALNKKLDQEHAAKLAAGACVVESSIVTEQQFYDDKNCNRFFNMLPPSDCVNDHQRRGASTSITVLANKCDRPVTATIKCAKGSEERAFGEEGGEKSWASYEGILGGSCVAVRQRCYGQPVVGSRCAADGRAESQCGPQLQPGAVAVHRRAAGDAAATSANQRLTFGLHLLYATGLRLSEVVAATVDDLQWVEFPADASDDQPMEGWLLRVIGKGQKEREVPLPAEVVSELARYMVSRGLDADPEDIGNQGAYLLGKASDAAERAPGLNAGQRIDPRKGIAATTFYDQIKVFFGDCARVLRGQGDAKGAERFHKASTHWMRHSHASHAIAGGMPIEIAQQNLGHASLATTTVYVTTEKRRRMKAVEAFWKD